MKALAFAARNAKELQRDILTSIFGIAFPLVLLVLLSIINSSIPEEAHMTLFEIKSLTGGICAFGLVFVAFLCPFGSKRQMHSLYYQALHLAVKAERIHNRLHTSANSYGCIANTCYLAFCADFRT